MFLNANLREKRCKSSLTDHINLYFNTICAILIRCSNFVCTSVLSLRCFIDEFGVVRDIFNTTMSCDVNRSIVDCPVNTWARLSRNLNVKDEWFSFFELFVFKILTINSWSHYYNVRKKILEIEHEKILLVIHFLGFVITALLVLLGSPGPAALTAFTRNSYSTPSSKSAARASHLSAGTSAALIHRPVSFSRFSTM